MNHLPQNTLFEAHSPRNLSILKSFFQLAEILCDMDLLLVISKQSTDPDIIILVNAISSGLQLCWITVLSELMNKGIPHLNFGDTHMNKVVNFFQSV